MRGNFGAIEEAEPADSYDAKGRFISGLLINFFGLISKMFTLHILPSRIFLVHKKKFRFNVITIAK